MSIFKFVNLTDVMQFIRTATHRTLVVFMLPCKCEINLAVLRKVS